MEGIMGVVLYTRGTILVYPQPKAATGSESCGRSEGERRRCDGRAGWWWRWSGPPLHPSLRFHSPTLRFIPPPLHRFFPPPLLTFSPLLLPTRAGNHRFRLLSALRPYRYSIQIDFLRKTLRALNRPQVARANGNECRSNEDVAPLYQ